ncbi:MAG: FecR domain-containing protein [Tannerella sp.]|jgi:ferric-dicitrate binding protein FerR (iron transport regulator)|nr:FecR domain-containing protein [Tannerella sp.]
MNNKYYYKYADFLKDDSFLAWKLFDLEEDRVFWKSFTADYPDKKKDFERALEIFDTLKLTDYAMTKSDKTKMMDDIRCRVVARKRQQRKGRILTALSAAAVFALLIALSWTLFLNKDKPLENEVTNVQAPIDSSEIRLIINENEQIAIANNTNISFMADSEAATNENNTILNKKTDAASTLAIHKLIVPRGKRSSLTLSDGTKVWINSGTTVEFPAEFQGYKREIQVDGEIFIEVAKDEAHPFEVHTSSFSVNVTGTSFNISAYEDDLAHTIVLVEGRVNVGYRGDSMSLLPEDMAIIADDEITKSKTNIYNHICWKDGLMQFQSEPLFVIFSKISRYYDVRIEFDEAIKNKLCTGKLVLFDNLEDVIKAVAEAANIEYARTDTAIVFSK